MRNFQKKGNRWVNIMQSKPVLILLGILVLIFAWNVLHFWNTMSETTKNKKIIEEKVAQLKLQKEKLTADINNLNTEEGKEKIFRENFGLAKEGEEVIVVVDNKTPFESTKTDSSGGFFGFLKSWFK